MNQIATCPNCQKQLTFDPASAGEVWLCPACGAVLRLPVETAGAAPPPLPEEPALYPAPKHNMVPWLILLGVVVLFQGVALIWYALPRHASWEQLHRQEVYDLKQEAEGLAAKGQPQRAYAKFRELEELVGGNPISDPALKSAIATAAQEQNEMVDRILRQSLAAAKPAQIASTQPTTQEITTQPSGAAAPAVAVDAPKPRRPDVHALPSDVSGVDDEQIGRAIQNGVQSMLDQFKNNRLSNTTEYPDDEDALAVYALLQAYEATGDSRLDPRRPFMSQVLDTLRRLPMNDHASTYGRSLRANALQLAGRQEDMAVLSADLQWLLTSGSRGAFWYPMIHSQGMRQPNDRYGDDWPWDNSNSQYGLLGVWAAAEAGLNVPRSFWEAAQDHWLASQLPDGEWTYHANDGQPLRSMTLAGLASLLVTQDYLTASSSTQPVNDALAPAIARGMAWLETGDNGVVPFYDSWCPGYTLYGLERVGLASGYKYFGVHDWYRESAALVVSAAQPDGGWGDPRRTSFALLFLARGRHPVIMSKVRFDGQVDDHPRDVANLASYSTRLLERPINWQVVPLSHDWKDWTDCPILFLSSRQPPVLQPSDEEKLRQYVLNGGLLLTQTQGDNDAMTKWATDLGTRLFTPYAWGEIPADHPFWSVYLPVKKHPAAMAISNGSRLLMVHLPKDLSGFWNLHPEAAVKGAKPSVPQADHTDDFSFGLNLFLYASGKANLRNRLISTAIEPAGDVPAAASINLAQLYVAPDSDPEPAAWPRFCAWFRRRTDLQINLVAGPLDQLPPDAATAPDGAPIAHITGVAGFTATDQQVAALRQYVRSGGVVLIDPCGGPNDFLRSVRDDLLPRAFADSELKRLDSTHKLLTASADGMSQCWPVDVRDYVRSAQSFRTGATAPMDRGLYILHAGKGAVILSSLDITSGLLGTNTWGIAGFTPDYSLALAKNFVLWAWDGANE